jgi:hypothetical protein
MPLERRPPRYELEAQTVVDHGEAPRGQRDTSPIKPGDMVAFIGWHMHQASSAASFADASSRSRCLRVLSRLRAKTTRCPLAPGQALLGEVIDSPVHRFTHLAAEHVAARRCVPRQKLPIQVASNAKIWASSGGPTV